MEILHILNGDATAYPFRKSGIAGDTLIWREVLSEGPAPGGLSEEEFWRVRFEWLGKTYKEREEELESKIGGERAKLEQFRDFSEVVLWFEHDLVCQVNLIYLLSFFAGQPSGSTTLSMISIDSHPEKLDFKGLGELSPIQIGELYPKKTIITGNHLQTAKRAWRAYSSHDPSHIEELLQTDISALPFLRNALMAHLQRFPSKENGLNRIEKKLLETGLESTPAWEKEKVLEKFWQTEGIYGMGDVQVMGYMDDLSPALLTTQLFIETTAKGKDVLFDNAMYYPTDRWLGGVRIKEKDNVKWYWDEGKKKLLKREGS
jgi:hypothetical protein